MVLKKCIFICFLYLGLFIFNAMAEPIDLNKPINAIIYEDNFESPVLKWNRWRNVTPAWAIAPSTNLGLLQEDTSTLTRQIIYSPGRKWTDYTLTCKLRIKRWGGQAKHFAWDGNRQYRWVFWSVALRVTDAQNGYRLEYAPWEPEADGLKQPYYRLVKYTNGMRTELSRVIADFHSDLDFMVRFEAIGKRLQAKIWPAGEIEPNEWTICAQDSDHVRGTISFLTANAAVLFDNLNVTAVNGTTLLREQFAGNVLPQDWHVLSGEWRIAPWDNKLVRTATEDGDVLSPITEVPLPAVIIQQVTFQSGGKLALYITGAKKTCHLDLDCEKLVFYQKNKKEKIAKLHLEPKQDYTLTLTLNKGKCDVQLQPYPLRNGQSFQAEFALPSGMKTIRFGYHPDSRDVSIDNLVMQANVSTERALKEYLRYICDWYMSLELPSGYPKTGTGSPELFIASYCIRTLVAGAQILNEPAYLDEALRWADFVTTSNDVLVPVITGTGREAIALRTYPRWSTCVNLPDIGSVLGAVSLLYPWGNSKQQARYREVLEKYSLFVLEGTLEDPLILGRGNQPNGWRITKGPDKGAFSIGYWWMERRNKPWAVATTNIGMDFYSLLYRITGNEQYRTIAIEATDCFLRRNVSNNEVFESFHNVIYGGEALIIAYENSADNQLKKRIEKAMGRICEWIVENQNADGTWNQKETPKNNRTNLVWQILNWYGNKHPEDKAVQRALDRTLAFHLNRENSRKTGVCEILRKTAFTGCAVADLLKPGITITLPKK